MLVMHDVTAERNAEEMRADFVANVSHELRSPLSSLVGFIETLRGPARDDPEARTRFLGIMESEAQRMTRLIGDLLSLSKVEADKTHPAGRLCKTAGSAGQHCRFILCPRRRSGIWALIWILTWILPAVIGEQDELTIVFQNLIANAISYGREGTRIRISVKPVDRIPQCR